MARRTTVKVFEQWIGDEANVALVLERIAGGTTLHKLAREVKQPYTCLHGFFHGSPERLAQYEAARRAWADAKQDEALELSDGVPADKDSVAKVRLQVEVRQNQARAYHRERWGERLQVEKSVTVGVDEALLGTAAELLKIAQSRPGRVLEHEPDTVTLPAPKAKLGERR